MTPLARYLTRQLLLPESKRDVHWLNRTFLDVISCASLFDATEVTPLVFEVGNHMKDNMDEETVSSVLETTSFLPNDITWLEFALESERCAFLLAKTSVGSIRVDFFNTHKGGKIGHLDLCGSSARTESPPGSVKCKFEMEFLFLASLFLVVVNSPRIIEPSLHSPHKGLQRKLDRKFGAGSYKLRDWTEIKLQINKPADIDDGQPHADRVTGQRALHFCRSHLRVKRGKLEYVRSHWRGDASLGIRRSTYKVAA